MRKFLLAILIFLCLTSTSFAYRCVYSETVRDSEGNIMANATVRAYIETAHTQATIYEEVDSTSSVVSVSTGSDGSFKFYVDRFDYDSDQKFQIVVTKGSSTKTYDDVTIDRVVMGTYAGDKTLTTHITVPKGVIYSGTITVTTGTITAGLYQIFSGTGTVSGLTHVYPEWFGAVTSTSAPSAAVQTANVTAIQKAVDSVSRVNYVSLGLTLSSVAPVKFSKGIYFINADIIPTVPVQNIIGDDTMIVQTEAAQNIFDFVEGYVVSMKGLKLIGGAKQIRFGNSNISDSKLYLNNVEFHENNADFAFQTYRLGGATNLTLLVSMINCAFTNVYQCAELEYGSVLKFKDGWVTEGNIENTGRALFVNRGQMFFDGMWGVPYGTLTPVGGRWIDNYFEFHAINSRFGGEGGGMPITYEYARTRTGGMGGGITSIRESLVVAGAAAVENSIIHLMTGIPQRLTIDSNDWVYSDNSDIIAVDATFDVAAYIGALGSNDLVWINIRNNAANSPLSFASTAAALATTDPTKVIIKIEDSGLFYNDLPLNDATPAVTGYRICKTNNGNPTTITMFDGGIPGQELKVIINDAVTTIDFSGTNLKGNAGVDWTPTTGDWMDCFFDGTNWYCSVHDTTA